MLIVIILGIICVKKSSPNPNHILSFPVIRNEIEGMASTFFSIGMIFWVLFIVALLIGSCCWYKVCREGADGDVCSLLF